MGLFSDSTGKKKEETKQTDGGITLKKNAGEKNLAAPIQGKGGTILRDSPDEPTPTRIKKPGTQSIPGDVRRDLSALEIAERQEWEVKTLPVWQPGDVILDTYEIENVISGGMGHVYIAHHRQWDMKLAIKSPNEMMLAEKDLFARILREAQAWTELGLHPNIAYCYYVRNLEKVPHVVIEYVDGGNLKNWIDAGKCKDYKTNLDLAIQFCHGMEYSHSKGMIHRDIKPANILITKEGILKITDFGLVRAGAEKAGKRGGMRKPRLDGNDLTMAGDFMGTEGYLSPEQAESAGEVDRRTDIFSFGVCLYEMFCGKRPYDITYGPRQEAPDPIALSHNQQFPPRLAKILKRTVQWDKNDRFVLFSDLAMELNGVHRDLYQQGNRYFVLHLPDMEADNLNNQGVSYLELGNPGKARECFEKSVALNNIHPQAVYNLGLVQWRAGEIDDLDVLEKLENCRENPSVDKETLAELTANIHLERFASKQAEAILKDFPLKRNQFPRGVQIPDKGCIRTFEADTVFAADNLSFEDLLPPVSFGPDGRLLLGGKDNELEGHRASVLTASFNPNGRFALSGSFDNSLKLWDVDTGKCIRTFSGHKEPVCSLSFSPDGRFALSGSWDKTLKLWNLETGNCIRTYEAHTKKVRSVSFSPDSRLALSVGGDKTLKLWEVATGKSIYALEGKEDSFGTVCFSPDGKVAIFGGKYLALWKIETGKLIRTFEGHTGHIWSVTFSPEGRYILSGSSDKTLKLWEIDTGNCIRTFTGHRNFVNSVSFSPDSRFALSAGNDKTMKLWQVETGKCLRTFEGHREGINSVSFSPDGKLALSASDDNTLKLWEMPDKIGYFSPFRLSKSKGVSTLREEQETLAGARNLFKKGEYQASYDALFNLWKNKGFEKKREIQELYYRLTQKGFYKNILVLNRQTFAGHTKGVNSISFSPGGKLALSGSKDKTLKLWEIESGKCIRTFKGHKDSIRSVSFRPDGKFAFSVSKDNERKMWEIESGICIRTDVISRYIPPESLSRDDRYALFVSHGNIIKLLERKTRKFVRTFEGHTDRVLSLSFSPDSRFVLSGSEDKTMKLWEIETGKCLRTFNAGSLVVSQSVSPNGKLAHSSAGASLLLWEIETGKLIHQFKGHSHFVLSAEFSPDGRFLLSASEDSTLTLWEFIIELEFPGTPERVPRLEKEEKPIPLPVEKDLPPGKTAVKKPSDLPAPTQIKKPGAKPPAGEERSEHSAPETENDLPPGKTLLKKPSGLPAPTLKKRPGAEPGPGEKGSELPAPEIPAKKEGDVKTLRVWQPGDVILDTYEIEQVISGGMGHVYIAYHRKWDMKLAIKSPNEMMLAEKDLFARILREARAWTELGLHPNIAYCYYVRNLENVPHVVIEYVDGGNLKNWIDTGKCKDYKTNFDLAIQFCHGMEFSHAKGMIHRDIKPANILITKEGILKITDFGLVRAGAEKAGKKGRIRNQQPAGNELTMVGDFMGTEGYLSPEQAESAGEVDERTDIFSFGVCLYEMFCGKRPYDITYGPRQEAPDPIALSRSEKFPPRLAELLKKTVQWDKTGRFNRFSDIRKELNEIYNAIYQQDNRYFKLDLPDMEADNLNNQGMSYMELGNREKARECLEKAFEINKIHPQAAYNLSLLQWRDGEIDDSEALNRLKECGKNPTVDKETLSELTANIHLERFAPQQAEEILKEYPGKYQQMVKKKEVAEMPCIRKFEVDKNVWSISISPDGRFILSGCNDKILRLWEINTGKMIRTFTGHTDLITSVSFSPDGRFALSGGGSLDKTMKLWDLETGECLRTFTGHTDIISSISFSPDGKYALTGGTNNPMRLWELPTGNCIRTFGDDKTKVTTVAYSPNGRWALSGGSGFDGTFKLWELNTGRCIRTFAGATKWIKSISLSPNGKLALTGSDDNVLKLWEPGTGQCIRTFKGHTASVDSVSFSSHGRLALSGSQDKTMKLWEIETGRCIRTFEGYLEYVTSVSFTPDSRFALSGGLSKTMMLWAISSRANYIAPLKFSKSKGISELKVDKETLATAWTLFKNGDYQASFSTLFDLWKKKGFGNDQELQQLYSALLQKGSYKNLLFLNQRSFEAHTTRIAAIAFSPDGRFVLSGGPVDKAMKLWEIDTGKCIRRFEGELQLILSVAFSPDAKWALSAEGNKIKLWEIETGRCVRTLTGHSAVVYSVSFNPDGRYALSGSTDKTLKLWERETGQCLRTFTGHRDNVYSVSVSPDGRYALSGSWDKTLKLWDIQTGQCLRTFEGHTHYILTVSFSPDGRFALSGSEDKTVKLWEIGTGKCIRTFTGHTNTINSVSYGPNGWLALSGSRDRTMKFWEIETGKCIRTFKENTGCFETLAFSPNSRSVISGGLDKNLRLWEFMIQLDFPGHPETNRPSKKEERLDPVPVEQDFAPGKTLLKNPPDVPAPTLLKKPHSEPIQKEDLSEPRGFFEKGKYTIANLLLFNRWKNKGFAKDRDIQELYSKLTQKGFYKNIQILDQRTLAGDTGDIYSISVSPDGKLALSGNQGAEKNMTLREIDTGKCTRIFTGHTKSVVSVSFSPNGRYALSGSTDKTIKYWEIETGQCIRTLAEHTDSVFSVGFSPDGRYALSGGWDKTLKQWEINTGKCIRTFTGHSDRIFSISISPHGKFALSASLDKTVKLWELETGRCIRTFAGHTESVRSVVFSPDSKLGLSGGEDKTLKLWNLETGQCIHTFGGHTRALNSVSFIHRGRFALSGSLDKTIKLWEMTTGKCIHTFEAHTGHVYSISSSPDSRILLSGGGDKTLRLWDFIIQLYFPQNPAMIKRVM